MPLLQWFKQSLRPALSGLALFSRSELHARIHGFIALGVIIAAIIFPLSSTEWLFVVGAIGIVIITEILNTAIEHIADFIHPSYHHQIKNIKDLAAASVLVAAIMAFFTGLIDRKSVV
mgnify:CR=1 FL=1